MTRSFVLLTLLAGCAAEGDTLVTSDVDNADLAATMEVPYGCDVEASFHDPETGKVHTIAAVGDQQIRSTLRADVKLDNVHELTDSEGEPWTLILQPGRKDSFDGTGWFPIQAAVTSNYNRGRDDVANSSKPWPFLQVPGVLGRRIAGHISTQFKGAPDDPSAFSISIDCVPLTPPNPGQS